MRPAGACGAGLQGGRPPASPPWLLLRHPGPDRQRPPGVAGRAAAAAPGPGVFAGTWPALASIFVSEVGDKTFFVAALLGMRRGKVMALTSSLAALASMTVISTAMGAVARRFPEWLNAGQGAVQLAAAACFVFFGLSSLAQARSARQSAQEEREEADGEVRELLRQGRGRWREWWQCALLVFLAEWADRSMIATVALAAAWDPLGVVLGATLGHALATSLAVYGAGMLHRYIDDATAKVVGGVLFLAFAVTTLLGIY
mmetsp:Transcript_55143/g.176727  ORF Transcript_55143/g.176727 Transcript_55143/m.176727 type:complete len:258 (+) Transcript_55143:185-958(+)